MGNRLGTGGDSSYFWAGRSEGLIERNGTTKGTKVRKATKQEGSNRQLVTAARLRRGASPRRERGVAGWAREPEGIY